MGKLGVWLTVLGIVAALGVGAIIFINENGKTPVDNNDASRQPAQPVEEAVQQNKVVVEYTDQGFSPDPVTVPPGTVVSFINNSAGSMWVASDEHPTHTELEGFDAKRNIAPGQSYEFKFTKTGKWGYHNHLQPVHAGSVSVE